MAITDKLTEIEKQYINWNYIGLAAGILTVLVSLYNVNTYLKKLRKQRAQ